MIIIPAIDLKGGRCVRLKQGRADDETVYSDDPADMARRWVRGGAGFLHVVDLDGAFEGKPVHLDQIRQIVKAAGVPVEVGGGIRTDDDIRDVLSCGVSRVVIGTRAFREKDSLSVLAGKYGEKIVVGIDARDGMVRIEGWVGKTSLDAVELAKTADKVGIQTIIFTDIATDGMLSGVNVDAIKQVCSSVKCDVVASGGVRSAGDVRQLADLKCANLQGVIVGKALYDGTLSLKELLAFEG